MTFSCGCEQDGSARCPRHFFMQCHCPTPPDGIIGVMWVVGVCPPCRIAKWRSVSLSSAATPTRGKV